MKSIRTVLLACVFALFSCGAFADSIDLNSATAEQLQTLQGIGPAKAAAIIAYREENGAFESIDELTEVSGIGEKTLEAIREQVSIGASQ